MLQFVYAMIISMYLCIIDGYHNLKFVEKTAKRLLRILKCDIMREGLGILKKSYMVCIVNNIPKTSYSKFHPFLSKSAYYW